LNRSNFIGVAALKPERPAERESCVMTSTAITDAMRDKALATAAQIIRFAQTAARDDLEGGHDLSLAVLRTADPLAYREVLDALILLEAQGFARRWRHGLCTIYAVRQR
jgi:hypothetical protein